jgi:hypothetical protein
METDRVTIEQFIERNRISLTTETVDRNPHVDGSDDMDNYKCVMIRRGPISGNPGTARNVYRMTVHFSKGIGHHGAEPEAGEVLSCLASDAAGIENGGNFEDWCSEYGYETDSRKALKTFKTCGHQSARLKNFLGDDLYDQLLWHTEAL